MATRILHDDVKPNLSLPQEELEQMGSNCIDEGEFADKLVETTKVSPALWSKNQMYEIEKLIQQDQMRRVTFSFGCLTGKELLEKIESDREYAVIAAGLSNKLPEIIGKYKSLVESFEIIHSRLIVGLAVREDMLDVIEAGKSFYND